MEFSGIPAATGECVRHEFYEGVLDASGDLADVLRSQTGEPDPLVLYISYGPNRRQGASHRDLYDLEPIARCRGGTERISCLRGILRRLGSAT